jgi:hypothetical protein
LILALVVIHGYVPYVDRMLAGRREDPPSLHVKLVEVVRVVVVVVGTT